MSEEDSREQIKLCKDEHLWQAQWGKAFYQSRYGLVLLMQLHMVDRIGIIVMRVCGLVSQESENYFDFSKLKQVSPSIVMQASDMLMRDFRMLSCQDIRWTLNSLKGHYAITRKVLCQTDR